MVNTSICCVCKNRPQEGDTKQSSYRFPRNDPQRAMQWIRFVHRAVGNNTFEPTAASRICEKHFEPTDFVRQSSVADSFFARNSLVRTAVPSLVAVPPPPVVVTKTKPAKYARGLPVQPQKDERVINYEMCQIRSKLAGKDVEILKLTNIIKEQKSDFQKQHLEEKRKYDTQIKAVTAERDRLQKTVDRQEDRLKNIMLFKQLTEMKLREARNEIKRLNDLMKPKKEICKKLAVEEDAEVKNAMALDAFETESFRWSCEEESD